MLPARAAAATYTIYFDKSAENWQTVYTWVWDANDGDRNYTGGTWPGTQITAGANPEHPALYSYTFDCDNTNPKLMCIFSNQGSPQTKDLDLHDKWVYTKEGPRCHIDNYPGGGGGDFPVTNPTALGRMTGYDDEGAPSPCTPRTARSKSPPGPLRLSGYSHSPPRPKSPSRASR